MENDSERHPTRAPSVQRVAEILKKFIGSTVDRDTIYAMTEAAADALEELRAKGSIYDFDNMGLDVSNGIYFTTDIMEEASSKPCHIQVNVHELKDE